MPRRPVQNKNVSERNPSISQAGTTGLEKMPKKQDNSREARRNSRQTRENTQKARRNSRKAQESIIKARERRVAEARSLNLLSNTFMTVALDDKPACQHVLRVYSSDCGNEGTFDASCRRFPGKMVTVQIGLRVYRADRKKTQRSRAYGPSRKRF